MGNAPSPTGCLSQVGSPGIDLDGGIMNFANSTKLSGEVDLQKEKATLEKVLDQLEEWSDENHMKFSKDKYKLLYLGEHDPGVQHRL